VPEQPALCFDHVIALSSAPGSYARYRPPQRAARQLPPESTDVIVENRRDGSTGFGRWTP
jgi:hypothetical protein